MANGALSAIRSLIGEQGRITFAEFMEKALYHPDGGYYTSPENRVGRDFYTAPAAHPAFGALIAVQLEQLWRAMGTPSPFYVIEVGAGTGVLARDVLTYSSDMSRDFHRALEYVAVDYQPPADSLDSAHQVKATGLPFRDVEGCILSNELLDAFPVHRFAVQGGRVMEVYVTLRDGELVEALDEPSAAGIEQRLAGLALDLPDGFRGEVNLGMDWWTGEVDRVLKRGLVLTIDYGHVAPDLYSPLRSRGTLRCYYGHTLAGDPYRHIGEQDITAHVDFSALIASGEERGLNTLGLVSQRSFLYNLGFQELLDSMSRMKLDQRRRDANRMAMLDLVKPGEMGDFKALAQAKGLPEDLRLAGFTGGGESSSGGRFPPAPLLSDSHMELMSARYPHLSLQFEHLWPFGKED